ncbi:MAG: HYR domain-containing protein, partial [Synechococcaceae cyanobacterium RL_1_2]|nr:HYR domain-containing protein [Synechococcaceae cyanobacterium RL_1_2]
GNITNREDLTITNSTISGGQAYNTGALLHSIGTLTITGSTISNNLGRFGSGVTLNSGDANIIQSTFSNNKPSGSLGSGGALRLDGTSTAAIVNSTFAQNSRDGSDFALFIGGSASATIQSSIVSANGGEINGAANLTSLGNNIFGNSEKNSAAAGFTNLVTLSSDIVATSDGTNPTPIAEIINLTLADNGGPTQTYALVDGSPAIDAGANPNNLTTDQRGMDFDRVVGTAVDIGAFELASVILLDQNGNLTLNALSGLSEQLTITLDNGALVITDANNALQGIGLTQVDGNTVQVAVSAVTGDISLNTQDGTDQVTINLGNGTVDLAGNLSIVTDTLNVNSTKITTTGTNTIELTGNTALSLLNSSLTTVGGAMTLIGGTGTTPINANTGTATGSGLRIRTNDGSNASAISSATGPISLFGYSNTVNDGVLLDKDSSIASTDTSPITIEGTGVANVAFDESQGAQISGTVTSANGDISITGYSQAEDGVDISLDSSVAVTGSGNLSIIGTAVANSQYDAAVKLAGSLYTITGNLNVTGYGLGGIGVGSDGGPGFLQTDTGNIIVTTDNINTDAFGRIVVFSTTNGGTLTLKPENTASTIGIGNSASGGFNLNGNELGGIQDGFSSITIGDTQNGTGAVDINASIFLDPVAIAGGAMTVTGLEGGTNTITIQSTSTVSAEGIFSPVGVTSNITQITGNVVLDATDTFTATINSATTPGTDYDQLQVSGTINLGNATLALSGAIPTTMAGDSVVLISNDDTDGVTGTFAGLAEGSFINFNNELWSISYQGGDGNDVILTINKAPSITSNTLSLTEGLTVVDTFQVTDPENETLTYSISGNGADDGLFTINNSTGELSFIVAPDFEIPGDGNADNVYIVQVQVSDGSNTIIQDIAITVANDPTDDDTTPPILTIPSDITVEATSVTDNTVTIGSATATDNVDTDVTITNDAPSVFPLGSTDVTWTATDDTGNQTTGTQTVTVEDTTAPILTVPSDVTVEATSATGTTATLGSATATDDVDTDVTIINDAPTEFPLGTTDVIWTAVDDLGNQTTGTQTVTVQDTTAPEITSDPSVSLTENVAEVITLTAEDLVDEEQNITFILAGINANLFVLSDNQLSFIDAPDFEAPKGSDSGDSNTYIVEIQARDLAGNTATQTLTIDVTNVNDNVPTGPSTFTLVPTDNNLIDLGSQLTDNDGDTVLISAITSGLYGVVAITGDQSLSYTPSLSGFIGTDSLTYTITDGLKEQTINLELTYVGAEDQFDSQTGLINAIAPDQVFPILDGDGILSETVRAEAAAQGADLSQVVDKLVYQAPANAIDLATIQAAALNASQRTDAKFFNVVGFYQVDDLTGAVTAGGVTYQPGDEGYAANALNRVDPNIIFTGGGGSTPTANFNLDLFKTGQFYAPFIIVNADNYTGDITQRVAQFLQVNPTNEGATAANVSSHSVAYFSYGAANPDGTAHIKSFGDNVFGFEDLPAGVGISDYDFNDLFIVLG